MTMTFDAAVLDTRWLELTTALGLPKASSQAHYADLCSRYSEPSRFYHTLSHIARMLQTIDEWQPVVGVKDATVRLAVWFHDAVYDSRRNDNEEQSARLAREALTDWHVPEAVVGRVERLILATKSHDLDVQDSLGGLFLDADLEILGSPPEEYARYSRAIREEYSWVTDEDYHVGRVRVLRLFLQRERIYRTPALIDLWEEPARQNLNAEIARLQI